MLEPCRTFAFMPQVDMTKLDAIIFVKVLEQGFQMLQNSSVPLIWDHVDEWEGANVTAPCSNEKIERCYREAA